MPEVGTIRAAYPPGLACPAFHLDAEASARRQEPGEMVVHGPRRHRLVASPPGRCCSACAFGPSIPPSVVPTLSCYTAHRGLRRREYREHLRRRLLRIAVVDDLAVA